MDFDGAIAEWRNLLGPDRVLVGDSAQSAYGADCTGSIRAIPAALRPIRQQDVQGLMQIAHRHAVPVYPISTGRNWGYGTALPTVSTCVIIDLRELRNIIDFDADLGVVTVEPGVTQQMLAEFLDAGGHPYMVPTTGAGPNCSLMGNALERGFGITPLADHFSAVTDIEAVLADGTLYRTALSGVGERDLARLFKWGIGAYSAGLFSQGNFGVVTRMSIILARRPECMKVALFSLTDDRLLEAGIRATRAALRSLPGLIGGVNLMNQHRVLAMAAPYPHSDIGSTRLIPPETIALLGKRYQVLPWTGFATLYGTQRTVAAAQKEISKVLKGTGSRLIFVSPNLARMIGKLASAVPGAAGTRLVRTAQTLQDSLSLAAGWPSKVALPIANWLTSRPLGASDPDPSKDGAGLIWYAPLVPMRPELVRSFVNMVHRITAQFVIEPLVTLTSLNDRLYECTIPILFDIASASRTQAAKNCYEALLKAGSDMGVYPYRLGVDGMNHYRDLCPEALAFHSRLRNGIDPLGLISPGRYA